MANLRHLGVFQKLLEQSELKQADRELLSGPGLCNVDDAHLAKVMGEVPWCSEIFNCRCSLCESFRMLCDAKTECATCDCLVFH